MAEMLFRRVAGRRLVFCEDACAAGEPGRVGVRGCQMWFGEFFGRNRFDLAFLRHLPNSRLDYLRLLQPFMAGKGDQKPILLSRELSVNAIGLGSRAAHPMSVQERRNGRQFGASSMLLLGHTLCYTLNGYSVTFTDVLYHAVNGVLPVPLKGPQKP